MKLFLYYAASYLQRFNQGFTSCFKQSSGNKTASDLVLRIMFWADSFSIQKSHLRFYINY